MKTTKYIAIRETYGTDNRMHRRYEEYQTAGIAVAWFKGSDLGVGRTVSIYEVECDGDELPCAKKEIPEHGTLIFRKKNAIVLYDKLAEEAKAEEETAAEATAAPVNEKRESFKVFVPHEMKLEDFDDPELIAENGGSYEVKRHLLKGIDTHTKLFMGRNVVADIYPDESFVDIYDYDSSGVFVERIRTTKRMKPSNVAKTVWRHVHSYLNKSKHQRRNAS